MEHFERSLSLPVSRRELFEWHRRPGAFERLGPSWQRLEVVSQVGGTIENGARLHFRAYEGPLWINWVARHEDFEAGHRFVDVAERSPFAQWRHVHAFEDGAQGEGRLRDSVSYRLPLHGLSHRLAGGQVEAMLTRMFRQRHLRTSNDLRRHAAVREQGAKGMRLLADEGLFGAQLGAFWTTGGNHLVRGTKRVGAVQPLSAVVALAPAAQLLGTGAAKAHTQVSAAQLEQAEVFVELRSGLTGSDVPSPALALARSMGVRCVELRTQEIVCRANPRVRKLARRGLPEGRGFIDLDDLLALVHHLIYSPACAGRYEAVVGQLPASFEADFDTLARSIAHQRGAEDEGAVARARARWSVRKDPAA